MVRTINALMVFNHYWTRDLKLGLEIPILKSLISQKELIFTLYKELLDDGIITEKEFSIKKKELLRKRIK